MSGRTGTIYWLGLITSRRIGDAVDKLLLVAMADHVGQDDTVHASIGLLADEAEVSERTARSRLKAMEERGWITRVRTRIGQRQGVYVTTLQRGPIEALPYARRPDPEAANHAGSDPCQPAPQPAPQPATRVAAQEPPNVEPPNLGTTQQVDQPPLASLAPPLPVVVAKPSITDRAHPDYGFDRFWSAYPERNGKRVGKAKALDRWRKLDYDTKAAAFAGVRHYRTACDADLTIAKDAERWLRGRCWEDWQDGPGAASAAATKADRRIQQAGITDTFLEAAGLGARPRELNQ